MSAAHNNREIADRFRVIALRFCSLVDAAPNMDRTELLVAVYRMLPGLIDEAVRLPEVELSEKHDELAPKAARLRSHDHQRLYPMLKEKLGDWDLYRHVFDPTKDEEAILGTLSDDLADIYHDLKDGLILDETLQAPPEDSIWTWRLLFHSHWGEHAISALGAIHRRLFDTIFFLAPVAGELCASRYSSP